MPVTPKERRLRAGEPWIVDRAPRRMAVVRTVGRPQRVAADAVPALYRAVYTLRMLRAREGRPFTVEPLRARWPNAADARPDEWIGEWALPVPDDVRELPAQAGAVELATWEYGPTAEILHVGGYAAELDSIRKLRAFADGLGYDVVGVHEEEYLTPPDAQEPRTVIRFAVRRRSSTAADG